MAKISIHNLSLTYSSVGDDIHALDGISFEVERGEAIALIGPSGCGKSTVLKLIAGLMKPDVGQITLDGEPILKPRRETALILQDYGLLPWKTVIDNAALGLKIAGLPKNIARERARKSLSVVGLDGYEKNFPQQLSGGMKQRLAIARSLALDADVVLMDEPLSALDALTREELQNVMLDLWNTRSYTQILVTHSIEEAIYLGQRIVLMTSRPGRVARIIENPGMGTRAYRNSREFFEMCTHLRSLLESEGAYHG
ncbi:MAG: ABC transporter ATP-binding protein [Coriobacteriia bacterium]|nr:ABC transporter ATP-binding protein [Coriobacteriia bacterium]